MSTNFLDTFGEWKELSVFIEMKPRNDLASLFIDVPPVLREKSSNADMANNERRKIKYEDIDVVSITDSCIRIGAPPSAPVLHKRMKEAASEQKPAKKGRERSVSGGSAPTTPTKKSKKKALKEREAFKPIRYGAVLKDVNVVSNSVCSPAWANNNTRLFMCKLQIEPNNLPLVQKTLHRLADEICKKEQLEEFAKRAHPRLKCAKCSLQLLADEYIMTIGTLPDDEWLATTQSVEFYCRDSCGAACDPNKHKHESVDNKCADKWLPNEKQLMISYANSFAHSSSIIREHVHIDENIVSCSGCRSQVGRIVKNHPDVYSLNHVAAVLTGGPKSVPYLEQTIFGVSRYMTQLVLNSCESQSSLKLVIRTLDKVPHLLVWLLDSYVVMANGELAGLRNEDEDGAILQPFPAIKLLYKVFNKSTVSSDPRANGEDTSVGIIDVPLPCCLMLVEMLLRSSHRLPPACRSVGQFFVGYLQFDEHI